MNLNQEMVAKFIPVITEFLKGKGGSDAVALLGEAYTRMGNPTLAADTRRVLQQNDPQHPWLAGNWPKGKGIIARLNPLNGN